MFCDLVGADVCAAFVFHNDDNDFLMRILVFYVNIAFHNNDKDFHHDENARL